MCSQSEQNLPTGQNFDLDYYSDVAVIFKARCKLTLVIVIIQSMKDVFEETSVVVVFLP